MFNFVYESKVEYANVRWYVVLAYWSKDTFFDEIVDLLLSRCDELRKSDVYDRIELNDDSESEYRDRSEDESESEIKIIRRIEHETQICSRCEIFSKAIAITFKWIRESFKFWFLIVRDSEFIIELRHIRWFRDKCDERKINDRDKKRWILEMIVVIIRFDHRWSKFCRVAWKFDDRWFIVYV
jgi:hypothetical protein